MQAFEAFLDGYYESVRRALTVALGDAGRAEDLAQEAFARALARWSTVGVMVRPVGWVYTVAINQARRDWRREQRPARVEADGGAIDVAGTVATSVSLKTAIALLAPRQRAMVVLRFLADLPIAEIAQVMGCAEGTVKSTLHTALAHLRVEMGQDEL